MQVKFFLFFVLVVVWGCKDHVYTTQDIQKSIAEAEQHTNLFAGKFVSIKKLGERDYTLVLSDSLNKPDSFVTLMPLDSVEIRLLRKTGNNIVLHYFVHYNPVRKDSERVVREMVPSYQ